MRALVAWAPPLPLDAKVSGGAAAAAAPLPLALEPKAPLDALTAATGAAAFAGEDVAKLPNVKGADGLLPAGPAMDAAVQVQGGLKRRPA